MSDSRKEQLGGRAPAQAARHVGPALTWRKLMNKVGPVLPHLVFWPAIIVNLFPLFYMFTTSFKGGTEYFKNPIGLPQAWTTENYGTLFFEKDFVRQLLNSVIVSVSTVIVVLIIGVLAAYAFSRVRFPGRQILLDFIVGLMAVPVVVTVVPLFALMSRAHLINQYPSAVVLYVGFCLPFSIYVLNSFFHTIPAELFDAAQVDGAHHLQIIWHVMVPLSRAPMVTLALVNGLWVWNELLIALMFLQSETSTTVMAALARGTSRDVRNIPLIMAGAFAASIPVLVVIGFGQRYFVKGFMGGYDR